MNNLQKAVQIELPKVLESIRDKMDNAKTPTEYNELQNLYLFLMESE